MLLRRVIKHFQHQEWTAIAIDFLIVVMGVFVGLQVSNWSAALNTDQQSVLFTERLTADLQEEAFSTQFLVEYYEDITTHALKALAMLENESTGSNEALLISAYRATQYTPAYRRRATYDELSATGNLGLIRDEALRMTAIRLYTAPHYKSFETEGENSRYRVAFRMAVPVAVQNAVAQQCGDRASTIGDYASIVDILDYECTTGLSADVLANAVIGLRSNETLVPLLRLRIMDIQTLISILSVSNPEILLGLKGLAKSDG
jgi:flagellar biosynthesis protein FliQ|tara:strand:+ start:143 stop:925 length:783 start_codon:yes stop_codon:yes gene_type:complete